MVVVGTAYVEIRAVTDRVASDIERALNGSRNGFTRAGREAGDSFNGGFSGSVNDREFGRTGERAGRSLSEGVGRGIDDGAGSVRAATSRLAAGGGGGSAIEKALFGNGKSDRAGMALRRVALQVDALAAVAGVGIGALASLGSGLFSVAAAAGQASSALIVLPASLGAAIQGIGTLSLAFKGVGEAFKAGSAAATAGAKATGAGAAAAAGATRASARAIENAQRSVRDAQQQAGEAAEAAAERVVDAQQGVKDALDRQVRDVQDAAEAVAEAQQGVADALQRQSRDIEDAAKAVSRAQRNVADALEEQVADAEAAADRVAEAQENLADTYSSTAGDIEDALDDVVRAEENLADAQRDSRRAQEDVNQARLDAIESLQQLSFSLRGAQISERDAALDLADATKELADAQYLPTGDRARLDAQLAYDRAQLNYEQARDRTSDLTEENKKATEAGVEGSDQVLSAREREAAAAQAVVDAEKDAATARIDLAKTQADAQQQIIDAIEGVDDAYKAQVKSARDNARDVQDAQASLTDALEDQAQTVVDAARDVTDAQKDLADAIADQGQTAAESARNVADARKTLSDALRDQDRSAADSAQNVADAQDGLAYALEGAAQSATTASAATDKYAEAMAKLSPQAREFVEYMLSIKDVFKVVKDAAGEELFPKLITSLQTIIGSGFLTDLANGLRETGSVIGDVAIQFANLFENEFFRGNFNIVLGQNSKLLGDFGTATVNLVSYFIALFAAADPLISRFGDWIVALSEAKVATLDSGTEMEAMTAKFNNAGDVAALLGDIFGNLIDGIGALGRAAIPAGEGLLNSFKGVTDGFAALQDGSQDDRLASYFDGVATNVRSVSNLVVGLGAIFLGLGDNPGVAKTVDILTNELLPILDEILEHSSEAVGPALANTLVSIAEAFAALSQTGALTAFLEIIGRFAELITSALGDPVIGPILKNLIIFESVLAALAVVRNFSGIGFLVKGLGGLTNLTGLIGSFTAGIAIFSTELGRTGNVADGISKVLGGPLGKVFDDLYLRFLVLSDAGEGAFGKLGFLFKGLSGPAGAVVKVLGPIGLIIGGIVGAVKGASEAGFFTEKWAELKSAVSGIGPAFEPFKRAFETILPVIKTVTSALGGEGDGSALGGAIAFIVDLINNILGRALNVVMGLFVSLVKILGSVIQTVGGLFEIIASIVTVIFDLGNAIAEVIQGLFTGDFSGVSEAFGKLGTDIADGLWTGIKDAFAGLFDLLKNLFFGIVDIFKDVLGIASPSTVMQEMGGYIVDGLIAGLSGIAEKVSAVWQSVVDTVSTFVSNVKAFALNLWDDYVAGLTILYDLIVSKLDGVVTFLSALPGKIAAFATGLWDLYVEGVTIMAQWIADKFNEVVAFISAIPAQVAAFGKVMWDSIINAVTAAKDWVVDRFVDIILLVSGIKKRVDDAIGDAFLVVRTLITAAKDWVLDRLVDVINLILGLKARVDNAIGDVFLIVRTKISEAKDWVLDRLVDVINLILGLKGRVDASIGDVFLAIRDKILEAKTYFTDRLTDIINAIIGMKQRVTDNIGDIFGAFGTKATELKTNLTTMFNDIVTAVVGVWDGLGEKLKGGAQTVRTKINTYLIDNINKVTTPFGLTIPQIPAFADGGYVRGPGGPRDDKIIARLSNGEGVLNARTVRELGGERAINALNKGRRLKKVPPVGGAIDDALRIVTGIKNDVSNAVQNLLAKGAGAALKTVITPVKALMPAGFAGDFAKAALTKLETSAKTWGDNQQESSLSGGSFGSSGKATPNGVGGLGPAAAAARAFVVRTFGVTNIGGYANRNVAGTGKKSDHAAGKAIDVMIPNYKSAPSIALGNRIAAYFVNNPGAYGTKYVIWRDQINTGGGWRAYRHPGGGGGDTLQHRDHVHVSVFDKGGMASGLGYMPKNTIKPERVLSPRQTVAFEELVSYITQRSNEIRDLSINNVPNAGSAIVAATGSPIASGPRTVQYITNHYPVAEATSTTVNRALQYAAAIGDI